MSGRQRRRDRLLGRHRRDHHVRFVRTPQRNMHHATCNTQHAACNMQHTTRSVRHTTFLAAHDGSWCTRGSIARVLPMRGMHRDQRHCQMQQDGPRWRPAPAPAPAQPSYSWRTFGHYRTDSIRALNGCRRRIFGALADTAVPGRRYGMGTAARSAPWALRVSDADTRCNTQDVNMRCNTAYGRPVPLRRKQPHRARTAAAVQAWRNVAWRGIL